MQKSKNQIAHEEAQKNLLIVVLMFAIIGLGGYSLFHVSDKLTEQSNQVAIGETKVVPVASYIKYRFRQIYGGGDVNSHLSNSTVVPQMTASQHRSAGAHGGAYVAPSVAAPSMNGGSGAGYTMRTTSSQSPHSYGGGGSAGGYGNGGGASATPATVSYSGGGYASAPSLALGKKGRTAASDNLSEEQYTGHFSSPLRTEAKPGYDGMGGMASPGGEWIWDEDEEDWVLVTPSDRPDDLSQVGTPIGDFPLLLLLLLCGGYLFCARRRRVAAE